MASLKDIAARLDISVSLVSKVLNRRLGTTGIRPALADRIQHTAAAMGYRKNTSAEALRAGRHDVIGVFIHQLGVSGSGIIEGLLNGISAEAMHAHLKLFLNFFRTAAEFHDLCRAAHPGVMDGLIVGGVAHPELLPTMQDIRRGGVPVVTIYDAEVHPALPNVGIDQSEIGRIATQHLLDRGCRRVVHIENIAARAQGYRKALREGGVAFRPEWIYRAPRASEFGHRTGEDAVQAFAARNVTFDGLVAQSDEEAVGAMNTLFRLGRSVPDDVRIIGVDDAPYCVFARVALSSVSQDFPERGAAAVRLLTEAIKRRRVKSLKVQPRLHPRDSTR